MKFSFIFGLCLLFQLQSLVFAEDQIKWGQPVNGLRIGVESDVTSAASDQSLTFKVTAQNVSQAPIALPTPDTFVLKSNPQSNDYHTTPLTPVIEKKRLTLFKELKESFYSSESGVPVNQAPENVVNLAPGQSVSWESIPLEKHDYFGERLPANNRTTVQRFFLQPDYVSHIHFCFENEQKLVAGKSVWIGQADSGVVDIDVKAPSTDNIKLEGSFSLPKQTYFVGEPMEATFTVTNKGDTEIRFPTGGDYGSTGRPERFSIRAVDEQGHTVPDPVPVQLGMGGGLGNDASITPGKSYTETLLVNQWCAFARSGKYKVTCERTLNIIRSEQTASGVYIPERYLPSVHIETTLDLTIEDNPAALSAYIAGLVQPLLESGKFENQNYEKLKSLAQVQTPAAFPEIAKLLDGSPQIQPTVVRWLAYYGSAKASSILLQHEPKLVPKAREEVLRNLIQWDAEGVEPLLATALHDSDHELRATAVLLYRKKYESCIPTLLSMDTDADPIVRRYLGAALGASEDPRAITVLIKLLHDSDPDPYIKIWAAEGLGKFKRMEGVPVMIDLLRDPKARGAEGNVMSALENLTGNNFSNNRKNYLDWWEKTGRAEYEKR